MNKKFFITIVVALFASVATWAQNANRSGFFLELGAGSFAVNPPMKSVTVTYKQSGEFSPVTITREDRIEYMNGLKYDFAMGYRIATSAHCAVNFKIDALFDGQRLNDGGLLLTTLMPGFRYTSPELFKNISLYGMLSAGAGMRLSYVFDPEYSVVHLAVCGSVELGVNFTEKLYAGVAFDIIATEEDPIGIYSKEEWGEYRVRYSDDLCICGFVGAKLGFRF